MATTSVEPMDADSGASAPKQTFHVGTRESILARVQTDHVVQALKQAWPDHHFEIHAMKTTGDVDKRTALHKFNEKALWTQELEVLLQNGELDFIVHSLKDMPTQLPHDLELGCVTNRVDPRDALVIKPSLRDTCHSLADLPDGAVVGTSSLRRIALMKRHHPHLKYESVRGNVGTRLAKLDNPDSEYSAIVLAVSGLLRLGMLDRINVYLSNSNGGMPYAVGQGALGIETRVGDKRTQELLARIVDKKNMHQALAERALMRVLEGGCSVPIGVETEWVPKSSFLTEGGGVGVRPADDYDPLTGVATTSSSNVNPVRQRAEGEIGSDNDSDEMIMRAIVVSIEGDEAAEVETRKIVRNDEEAEQFGFDVARLLVEKGADKILEKIQLNRGIIAKQGQA